MALVYLAEDLKNHRPVAIKVLRPELSTALGPERFRREIETVTRLSHPNILPLYESDQAAGELYYVMPFVAGESLRGRLSREKQLPLEDALQITLEVADALSYAHSQGIVHRDIKPDNILFQAGHAVVSDFGIARVVTSAGVETLTATGLAVGTPAYMSPEQASGDRNVDARCDQYSLACVLYEMLAGDPPYTASSAQALIARKLSDPLPRISVVRERVPAHVQAALERALARVPADRYRTMADFAAALRSGRAPHVAPVAHPRRLWRSGGLPRRGVAAGVVLAGVALAGWFLLHRHRGDAGRTYPDHSAWSAWRGWEGEQFAVVGVADSLLIVNPVGTRQIEAFDGEQWSVHAIPDSLDLLPNAGPVIGPRLLAIQASGGADESRSRSWWVSASTGAAQPLGPTPEGLPPEGRPSWWTDGHDFVTWFTQIWKLGRNGWVNEAVGSRGLLGTIWGRDMDHRFAIAVEQRDSLLRYDGMSWTAMDILGPTSAHPAYSGGATFPDGATVVVGSECITEERCRPIIVGQKRFDAPWLRVAVPEGRGMPVEFPRDTAGQCDPGRFDLGGVAGRSRDDHLVWGRWLSCDRPPGAGCPPKQPCVWQIREGRLSPVEDLVGHVVQQVVYIDTAAYALLDDGMVWRRVGSRWRAVTRVPMPIQLVGASPFVMMRSNGGEIRYAPGLSDTLSPFFTSPLSVEPDRSVAPRQIVVADTTAAMLTHDGAVLVSRCRRVRGTRGEAGVPQSATGAAAMVLRCPKWSALPNAQGRISAIAVLSNGRVIGVGPRGFVVSWGDGRSVYEQLPGRARNDSLWSVVATPGGEALAIGMTTMVRRDAEGRWVLVRLVSEAGALSNRFAALPDGDLAVAGSSLHLWDRTSGDTTPAAILYRPTNWEALGPLQPLPDGRLVAGLLNRAQAVSGRRILVWASPPRANHMQVVDLPITVDIASLATDGRRLYVAGPGGALSIPLDSLPFARAAQRN